MLLYVADTWGVEFEGPGTFCKRGHRQLWKLSGVLEKGQCEGSQRLQGTSAKLR
jgi:hypothetical protein